MKKIYIIISLILFSVLNAQIVNIPDIHFKNVLLTTNYPVAKNSFGGAIDIDANNDGQIQSSEAAIVSELFLYKPNYWHTIVGEMEAVTSLEGIKGFVNLKKIYLTGFNSLTSIDLSDMTSLEEVRVDNNITLTSMNIQGCTNLNLVRTNFNKLTSLLLQGCQALTEIDCSDNQLQALDFSGNPSLYNLNTSSNKLVSINLGNLPALQSADLSFNNLNNVTFNNNTTLRTLNLAYNNFPSLLFSQIPNLKGLNVAGNKFSTIDVSGLSQLESIQCSVNLLTTLDLSQNHNLMTFNCDSNYTLQSLFIKNGKNDFLSIYPSSFLNTPNLSYICVDDFEASNVTSLLPAQSNCVINSYCSYVPGGIFYTIQGNTKYDGNNNGCDTNDPNKSFQKFNLTNGNTAGSVISNNTGNYSIPVQAGSHIITPVLENPTYFNISPPSITVNFPNQANPLTQNFCLTANGTHNDLEIVVIPVNAARPGFDTKYKIIYKNKGTTSQSGTLVYNFNDNLMNYLNSTIAPNTQSTGILSWNFANLLPFETKEITVTFKLNTPIQTPPLNGGDVLHYTAQINGATDDTPSDNTFTLNQNVVNSFDPNDKTCLEGASITQAKVGDYIHYLIRFENTGTANAKNIVVKDEIDVNKFDLSSLIPLNGSHNFVTRITNPNVVEFIFENIQLPFDDANNDGYVSFKIKTKSNLIIGDSFSNTAKIYFDYNAPIITNTSTTSVQNTLGTSEINNDKIQFIVYPNPVKDVLFIKSKEKIVKAEIYDIAGRILSSVSVTDNSINTSELTKGNYMIKLFTKDNSTVQKFMKN